MSARLLYSTYSSLQCAPHRLHLSVSDSHPLVAWGLVVYSFALLLIPYLYPYAYEVCSLQLPFKSAEHVHVHLPNELRRRSIPRDSIDSSSHFSLQHSHLNSISSALGGGGGLDGTASSTLAATADDGQASFTRSVEISKPEEATLASASAVSASNPSLVSSSSVASLHPPLPHAGSPAPVRFKVSSPQVSADDSGTMCPVLR